jgi:hypothetical protein
VLLLLITFLNFLLLEVVCVWFIAVENIVGDDMPEIKLCYQDPPINDSPRQCARVVVA